MASTQDTITTATADSTTTSVQPTTPHNDHPVTLPATRHRHIWVVTGPAGCGKTTVAVGLAGTFAVPYLEGDAFHPQANIAKMAAGHPLTDEDRWDWLAGLRDAAVATITNRHSTDDTVTTATPRAVVVTCSALKLSYRAILRKAQNDEIKVHFVFLHLSPETLYERVAHRQGHYMKAEMVRSQIDALEVPGPAEQVQSTHTNEEQSHVDTTSDRPQDTLIIDAAKDKEHVATEANQGFLSIMKADAAADGKAT